MQKVAESTAKRQQELNAKTSTQRKTEIIAIEAVRTDARGVIYYICKRYVW
jgi:hypothetical protein